VGKNFGPISIDALKNQFPFKTFISFPSIYFDGYFPSLMYLRKPEGGTLKGVIGDFHDMRVVKAFLKGKSVEETLSELTMLKELSEVKSQFAGSLQRLGEREKELDIKTADFIFENSLEKRLFYVFNHPSNDVLLNVARQFCSLLDIEVEDKNWRLAEGVRDYLTGSQAAVDFSVSQFFREKSENDLLYANRQGDLVTYSIEEYISSQFKQYEEVKKIDELLAFAIERRNKIGY
jgi:hypothetical protein